MKNKSLFELDLKNNVKEKRLIQLKDVQES